MSTPFAAPYAPPAAGAFPPPPPAPRRGPALGIVALVVAAITVPAAAAVGGVAAFRVGLGSGKELAGRPLGAGFDLSVLTPVRFDVLAGEIAFWAGTVLGLWALVQGIVAVVTRRGRGQGVGAIVIAAVGPVLFAAVVAVLLQAGLAAGTGIGG